MWIIEITRSVLAALSRDAQNGMVAENMKQDAYLDLLNVLSAGEAPRVWSFIVTVFGDLAQHSGDTLSGSLLGELLSPVGVKPEAMRVALHRLRNDGWIETRKTGRVALHSLSASGLAQTQSARKIIYARERPTPSEWHLLWFPSDAIAQTAEFNRDQYVALTASLFLGNGSTNNPPQDAVSMTGQMNNVPSALVDTLAPEHLRDAFTQFAEKLQRTALNEQIAQELSPFQTATLRALIVHHWRKLVLRLPVAPDILFGSEFSGLSCRTEVMRALDVLERPALSTLTRSAL